MLSVNNFKSLSCARYPLGAIEEHDQTNDEAKSVNDVKPLSHTLRRMLNRYLTHVSQLVSR